MQPNRHIALRRSQSEQGKGIAGTLTVHLGILALLLFVGFSSPKTPEADKGIMVNFGTDETGFGEIEPSPPAGQMETTTAQPVATVTAATDVKSGKEEALVTQNIDKEAPAVKKIDPEAEKKRKEQIESERIRKAEVEAENIKKAQADAERKKIEAEQKRAGDIVNRTKNALSNSKNSGTNSTSEGIAGGPGNQGVPTGSVDSKVRGPGGGTGNSGISYDLQGRGFQSLPNPKYEYQGEGKVVVEVSVDRSGKVTQAVPGGKGSTTLDEYLLSVAKEAALKATFQAQPTAPLIQKGTITYNFILK